MAGGTEVEHNQGFEVTPDLYVCAMSWEGQQRKWYNTIGPIFLDGTLYVGPFSAHLMTQIHNN